MRKPTVWVSTRSNTNWPVQSQEQARSLKFWIKKVEELYYQSSETKGADQLRSYCEADLHLCFRLCRLLVFPCSSAFRNELYPILISWVSTCREHVFVVFILVFNENITKINEYSKYMYWQII